MPICNAGCDDYPVKAFETYSSCMSWAEINCLFSCDNFGFDPMLLNDYFCTGSDETYWISHCCCITKYSCVNGQCVADVNGDFLTLASCQNSCSYYYYVNISNSIVEEDNF